MCTIGAIRLGENDFMLFKNKDFARANYDDRVVSRADWFGPQGLETFSDDASTPSVYSGLSIGANRHGLLACVNHVKITEPDYCNYDLLVEVALSQASGVNEAVAAIESHLQVQPSWRGNLILADSDRLAAVEVRERETRVEYDDHRVLRANHQPLFGETASDDGVTCSASRLASAQDRIDAVDSPETLMSMLASHDRGDTGICNHGTIISTVYSYVLHRQAASTQLYVAHGHPCRNPWVRLDVPLGNDWDADAANRFVDGFPGAVAA